MPQHRPEDEDNGRGSQNQTARDEFISRCMGDPEKVREFPDPSQRFAVCSRKFEETTRMTFQTLNLESTEGGHTVQFCSQKPSSSVYSSDGVALMLNNDSKVIGAVFDKNSFASTETVKKWLLGNIGAIEQEGIVKLESGTSLYAPMIFTPVFEGEQGMVVEGDRMRSFLTFSAVPITPGKHKGFEFTQDVIDAAMPMFEAGVNIVQNHQLGADDVVGRVLERDGRTVTGVVFDIGAAEKIRKGVFHSVSSHFLVSKNEEGLVTKINKIVELTLTETPADPNAIIIAHSEAQVFFEQRQKRQAQSINQNQPPVQLEANQSELEETMENQAEDSKASTTVELEALRSEMTEMKALLQAAEDARVKAEEEKARLEEEQAKVELERTINEAARLAEDWVKEAKITPAQREAASKLLSLPDPARSEFVAFVDASPGVAPLGGAAAVDIGVVETEKKGAASVDPAKMSDEQLEQIQFLATMQYAEASGHFGNDLRRKHQKPNAMFGAWGLTE